MKAVMLLKNFSFGLIHFINLSTTFCIQRFLTSFYFFHKKRVFYSWGQRFLHLLYGWRSRLKLTRNLRTRDYTPKWHYAYGARTFQTMASVFVLGLLNLVSKHFCTSFEVRLQLVERND